MTKILTLIFSTLLLFGCSSEQPKIENEKVKDYAFLEDMYKDNYYPNHLVDKGKSILINLCAAIEKQKPESTDDVYKLTWAATNEFNQLANDFGNSGSEIETVAREIIADNIAFILDSYGYKYDIETAIKTREW